MAKEPSPAFQFYPRDFISDENVLAMDLAERGAYITLMCICWTEGSIPSDIGRLARILHCSREDMARMWEVLAVCFVPDPDDPSRLVHPRLEEERKKQAEWREKSARGGRKSGQQRRATVEAEAHGASAVVPTTDEPNAKGGSTTLAPPSNTAVCSLQSAKKDGYSDANASGAERRGDDPDEARVVAFPEPPKPKTLRDFQNEAAQLIRDELWQSKQPPARFGVGHSMSNELSVWKRLVKYDPPEDVNGAIKAMRRVGQFKPLEPLSLLMFQSREPECRELYQRCLAFHRKQVAHEAAKQPSFLRVSVGHAAAS